MNRLLSRLYGKRIAIVGNGPVSKDYSDEIDNSDIVIRFNHFYRYESGLTGKRVDIVMQTVAKAWFDARFKHEDIIRKYNAEVFLVKKPEHYIPDVHMIYGTDIKVNNYCRYFERYTKFTTGGCFLLWLADNLSNAEVKIYGFEPGETWTTYIKTDAAHYRDVADEERIAVDAAIARLSKLTITNSKPISYNTTIVIPVKGNSLGAPGKNKLLLPRCIEECKKTGIDILVLTDSEELANIAKEHNVSSYLVPPIDPLSDVTNTLRYWRDKTNYFGDILLVQCTSHKLKSEWIINCLDKLKVAPITATATELDFKVNAIFLPHQSGIYLPALPNLGWQSVPRQKLPRALRITGAVEAIHSENLDLDSMWMGGRVEMIEISQEDADDIDTVKQLNDAIK